jgi:PAS domain S-box-containing protein
MNQRKESRFAGREGNSASIDNLSENCGDRGSESGAGRLSAEAIDFLPDAILAIDIEGKVITWNRAMEKLTGALAEDMIGKGDYEHALPFYGARRPILVDLVLMPEDQVDGKYDSLEREGKTLTVEIFIPTFGASGSYLWAKASPLYDSQGKLIGAIESIRDITEKKKIENKVCSMKRLLAEVIDFLPDATFSIDSDGKVITWNRAMEKMTGAKAEDMIGKGNYEYALPFYGLRRPILADLVLMSEDEVDGKYDSLEREGKTLTVEIFIPTFGASGSYLWAKASPLYDPSGRLLGAIESIRDVTERKRAEQALQRSEQEKAAILSGLKNVAVEYLDPQMRIIWLNAAVQKHLGLTEEEVKGRDCFELIQGLKEPCTGCTAKEALRTGKSQDGVLATPDGRVWVSRSSPIKDANQQVTGVVNVAVNITHLKRTEEKLKNIIDFLPDATLVINKEGEVIAWNRALEDLTGIKSAEMLGQGDYKYALPIYGERRPMLIDLAMTADEAVMGRYPSISKEANTLITEVYVPKFRGHGAYLWAKATPLCDASGKLLGAIESIRDMTSLRNAEEKLERSKAELRIASDIQRSFLPERIPPLKGFDLAATSIPAMEVGGDFYDFIPGDQRLGMVIADVSGKSIPAALFMALSRTIVRANATHHEKGTEVLQDANDMIAADSRSGMFVTLFYGVLDERSRSLIYANAGHPPPLLFRGDGKLEVLEVTGIALGVVDGVKYEERQIDFRPGDILVLYTDGVNEAINDRVEQYGLGRLCEAVRRSSHLSAQGIMDDILQDISLFVEGQAQFDDITMIVVKAG